MKKGDKKWYKSYSNWLLLIACTILIFILVINVSIMMQAKKDEDKVPSVFGIKPFMVLSGSMETEIRIGDLILTRVVDPSTLKADDIIAFRDAEGTVTTHRIIDIVVQEGVTYFITKGDNNNSQDRNLVEYKDVEGIYIGRIPGLGSIMKSVSEPTTIMVIVIGITIIFVIGFMISNRKQQEKDREEFLEYKRKKELEEQERKNKEVQPKMGPILRGILRPTDMPLLKKEKIEEQKEYEEFLEFKKMKEQQKNQNSKEEDEAIEKGLK